MRALTACATSIVFDPLAVGARDAADIVQPVLDLGDLVEQDAVVDRLAAAALDHDVAELIGRRQLAHGADVVFPAPEAELPGGQLGVFVLDGVQHIGHRKIVFRERPPRHPDPQVGFDISAIGELADAAHRGEAVLECVLDVACQVAERMAVARERHPQDRLILGIGLADDRRVDIARQPALCGGHLVLDFLQRVGDVSRQLEFHAD